MRLEFRKMHGLGNDFVMLDGYSQPLRLSTAQYRWLADRHFGIGCDQILLVEAPRGEENDFRYRIFNADGGEVEQCGNGARCFARFVTDLGLTHKNAIRVETQKGVIVPELTSDGLVRVNMGYPRFAPADVPFVAETEALTYELQLADGEQCKVSVVSMGNPHAVQRVEDVDTCAISRQGPQIENHSRFPERVNAGFMQVLAEDRIRLRVYERGSGETLACGTGACAAVVAGIRQGYLSAAVHVHTRGGDLSIEWQGPGHPVWMTGPAVTVFSGMVDLPEHLPE
jgi:diaminopimelate epimerase